MKIVHAADIHLDSPLRGLARLGDDDLAHTLRQATRRAFVNLIELVLAEKADALVLAGDTYDGDWKDYATGRFFVEKMADLHDAGIPVFMVSGNHDAESEITRSLRLPPNVRMLDTAKPESVVRDNLGLAVHGQGFATKAIVANLASGYPDRVPGLVNVGVLHTSVAGAEGHEPYAPCSVDDLTAKGYEYFALGHVHARQILVQGRQTVAFSGNTQGRHPRETGPKGALVVELRPGEAARVDFRELDVARWEQVEIDVTGTEAFEEAMDVAHDRLAEVAATAGGRPLVARIRLRGESAAAGRMADPVLLREELEVVGGRVGATVEKVRSTVALPRARKPTDAALLEAVSAVAEKLAADPAGVKKTLESVEAEVGRVLREGGMVNLRDDGTLAVMVRDAADVLRTRLAGGRT